MAKTIKKIIAITLSFLCGAIAGTSLTVVSEDLNHHNQRVEVNHNDQLSFSGFLSNGIALTASAEETVASSDTVRLTATLLPEGTTVSRNVHWSVAWKNPSATWASGKTVTDYVSLTPTSSGALTADLKCKKAFGEQVIVTVTSEYNPELTATCTVDYAQKVTGVELYFGNVTINLGGDTFVKYELSSSATGSGGEIYADIQTNDVYTISEDFTCFLDMTYLGTGSESVYFSLKTGHPTGMDFMNRDEIENWYGEEVYFDYNHDICNWFIMTRAGDVHFDSLTTAEIMEEFEGMTEATMYAIKFNITGVHSSYSYTSTMKCNGYTNNTPLAALSVDHTAFVF